MGIRMGKLGSRAKTTYRSLPRYTKNNAGTVAYGIAARIAREEKREHLSLLAQCNPAALRMGLRGIIERVTVRGTGFDCLDLITGDTFFRPNVVRVPEALGGLSVVRGTTVLVAYGEVSDLYEIFDIRKEGLILVPGGRTIPWSEMIYVGLV